MTKSLELTWMLCFQVQKVLLETAFLTLTKPLPCHKWKEKKDTTKPF